MKKITVLTVAIMLMISNLANAQTTIKAIKERGFIKVGTSESIVPFTFKDKEGKLQGIDIDLAKIFAAEMGVEVKFVKIEFANLMDSLKAGNIDVIFSAFSITTSRNMEVLFTQSYYQTGKAILSKKGKLKSGKIKNINNAEVSLVAIKNSSSADYVKNNFPLAKLTVAETNEKCVELLNSSKADAMVSDIENCESIYFYSNLEGNYNYTLFSDNESHQNESYAAAVSVNDFLFYNLLNNFLLKIDKNNEMNIINQDWYKYTEETKY